MILCRRARDMLADVLQVEERVHGAEHSETLVTRRNLARLTGEAGDAASAKEMLTKLLLVYERIYGSENHRTSNVRTTSPAGRSRPVNSHSSQVFLASRADPTGTGPDNKAVTMTTPQEAGRRTPSAERIPVRLASRYTCTGA